MLLTKLTFAGTGAGTRVAANGGAQLVRPERRKEFRSTRSRQEGGRVRATRLIIFSDVHELLRRGEI